MLVHCSHLYNRNKPQQNTIGTTTVQNRQRKRDDEFRVIFAGESCLFFGKRGENDEKNIFDCPIYSDGGLSATSTAFVYSGIDFCKMRGEKR